jgi:hypothetical protein
MEPTQYRNAGRKLYPKVVADKIIEKVAAGKSLKAICEDTTYPCVKTVYNWISEDVDFSARYVAAVRQQVEARAAATK